MVKTTLIAKSRRTIAIRILFIAYKLTNQDVMYSSNVEGWLAQRSIPVTDAYKYWALALSWPSCLAHWTLLALTNKCRNPQRAARTWPMRRLTTAMTGGIACRTRRASCQTTQCTAGP
jgi:hypothetical protein